MNKFTFSILGIFILLVIGFFTFNNYIYNAKQADNEVDQSISSFAECAAIYPVMESYPEQCITPDGKHFIRDLPEEELAEISHSITVQGEIVCLPHWDMSGPVTMECAFGLLSDSGDYYVLRASDLSDSILGMTQTGVSIELSGTFIPGSHRQYRSIGTIEVESISNL